MYTVLTHTKGIFDVLMRHVKILPVQGSRLYCYSKQADVGGPMWVGAIGV